MTATRQRRSQLTLYLSRMQLHATGVVQRDRASDARESVTPDERRIEGEGENRREDDAEERRWASWGQMS